MKKDNKNTRTKENKYPQVLAVLKQNIRKIRKDHGFRSAESFAEYLDVSLKTVQGWENLDNDRWPDLAMMIHLCEKTGCDLDYLLDRIKEPTHGIKYVCDQTGLSVEAVKKLTGLKGTGLDDLLSEIITHKNAPRLLRVLLLASDADEIAWLNLDELPRGLLSAHADKPIDFSVGVGSDVADFLVSQEIAGIVKDIRERKEKAKQTGIRQDLDRLMDVYTAKQKRQEMIDQIDALYAWNYNWLNVEESHYTEEEKEAIKEIMTEKKKSKARKTLTDLESLRSKLRNISLAEWRRGVFEQEWKKIGKENAEMEANDNG